jgi:hypothetical protein
MVDLATDADSVEASTSMMDNIRDLFGYTLDLWDRVLFRHRIYSFCKFTASVFSEEKSDAARLLQPIWLPITKGQADAVLRMTNLITDEDLAFVYEDDQDAINDYNGGLDWLAKRAGFG